MAVTAFRDITWGPNENISSARLNEMANNARFLFDNMPRGYYRAYGVERKTGIKIAAGVAYVTPNKKRDKHQNVPFGSFFSAGSKPVVVTGLYISNQSRIHHGVKNMNGRTVPDHHGFRLTVSCDSETKKNVFTKAFYIPWIAVSV